MKQQHNHFLLGKTLRKRGSTVLAALVLTVAVSGTLSACGAKAVPQPAETGSISGSASSSAGSSSSAASSAASSSGAGSSAETGTLNFSDLISLLGMTRDDVIAAVGETPVAVDEGGLGFDKTGIRVWFDAATYTKVSQVLIMTDAFDLNGVRVGDSFSEFKKVFGEPISDRDGDAHFSYNDIYLSVVRDTSSGNDKTIAVYLLQEDF